MSIKIAAMEKFDIPEIVDIWYEVSLAAHNFVPKEYWRQNRDLMATNYIPMSETYKAVDGERIVGFISLLNDYLAALFVMDEFQGRGVGSLLLNHAKSLKESLQLKVYSKNINGVEFYKSKGFSITSESLDSGSGEMEFSMTWKSKKFYN